MIQVRWLRRAIGTFYLLAPKLVFHNSDLNKSTTVCKVGDLEGFPKAFLDLGTYTSIKYTSMRCTPMRYTPMSCTPIRYTPVRYMPMRCTPVRYTPMRCTPGGGTPMRCTPVRDIRRAR